MISFNTRLTLRVRGFSAAIAGTLAQGAFWDTSDAQGRPTGSAQVRTALKVPYRHFVRPITSVVQEGWDCHFCHAVFHWAAAGNHVDLEQRILQSAAVTPH